MAEGESPCQRVIIPKDTLERGQNNVIEIPESCEDSRVLIARLQARFNKPPGYYPPKTNPDNKFERRIGDHVVALGMPPLSPLREERHNYQPSLSQYGSPKPIPYESYEPSYFGHDTTHGSDTVSGKFDYCVTSTPKQTRPQEAFDYPSPHFSPIKMGRDIFAPEHSVYQEAYTPTKTPPPRPTSPARVQDCSCSSGNQSMPSPKGRSGFRTPSPRRPPQRGPPPRRPRPDISDKSISMGNISDAFSFEASRAARSAIDYTPDSIKGMSQIYRNLLATPTTPIPEELHNTTMNVSMAELDSIELEELRTVQDRIRSFQEARRELVLSILSLPEAEVSM